MKKIFFVLLMLSCFYSNGQQLLPYNPLLDYHYIMSHYHNGPYVEGVKIVTQIPFGDEHMPIVHINGYNKDGEMTIGMNVGWYGDGGSFNNPSLSIHGQFVPEVVRLAEENGYVVIWFSIGDLYDTRFTISIYGEGYSEVPTWYEQWEVRDESVWGNSITDVTALNRFNDVEARDISAQNVYTGYLSASSSWIGNSTGARLRLGGASNFGHTESFRSGWGVFDDRLDVTHSNQPSLQIGRTLNYSGNGILGNAGGGLILAVAGNNGSWGIGNPGDALVVKEGSGGGSLKFNSNTDYKFYTSGVQRLTLSNNGNFAVNGKVMIGTVDPSLTGTHLLAVNGSAVFTKVKVKLYGSGWPDYVFEPDYKLRPLTMVEHFIKTHKHLPEVPSAKDIEAEGLDIGETQALLLRKIEELTLYLIEQNKQNLEQQQTINQLLEKVKFLEKQVKKTN